MDSGPPTQFVIISDLHTLEDHARGSESKGLLLVVALLKEILPKIPTLFPSVDWTAASATSGMCLELSTYLHDQLESRSIVSQLLAGDLEVAPKSWLEHYVNLLKMEGYWLTVDLAASQLARFQGKQLIALIVGPDWDSLTDALHRTYGWWTAPHR